MGQYFWVFFNPNGRLPRNLYFVYGIPFIGVLVGLRMYVASQFSETERPPAWLLLPLFVVLWMQACVTLRRLRDCGWSGALPLAIAAILGFDEICRFFPDVLGDTGELKEQSTMVTGVIFLIFNWLFKLTCAAAIAKEGDSGPNVYGPPLGGRDAQGQARHNDRRRKRLEQECAEYLVTPTTAKPKASGKAATPTPSRPAEDGVVDRLLAGRGTRVFAPQAPADETLVAAVPARQRRAGEFGRRSYD